MWNFTQTHEVIQSKSGEQVYKLILFDVSGRSITVWYGSSSNERCKLFSDFYNAHFGPNKVYFSAVYTAHGFMLNWDQYDAELFRLHFLS